MNQTVEQQAIEYAKEACNGWTWDKPKLERAFIAGANYIGNVIVPGIPVDSIRDLIERYDVGIKGMGSDLLDDLKQLLK